MGEWVLRHLAFLLSGLGELGVSCLWYCGAWLGYGALAAVLSVVAGLVAFVLLTWATAGRLETRDLPESVPG